jgi:hypothetical protein
VIRRLRVVYWMLFVLVAAAGDPRAALAQGGDLPDAGAAAVSASPAPTGLAAGRREDASADAGTPRPVRGPSVRERGGRRSRGASTASGALMLVMLVGAMGYYVWKRLRR